MLAMASSLDTLAAVQGRDHSGDPMGGAKLGGLIGNSTNSSNSNSPSTPTNTGGGGPQLPPLSLNNSSAAGCQQSSPVTAADLATIHALAAASPFDPLSPVADPTLASASSPGCPGSSILFSPGSVCGGGGAGGPTLRLGLG